MKKLLKRGLIPTLAVFMFISMVYAIDFNQGTVFKSDVTGGNITFAADITADTVTWVSDQVRFANFTYDGGVVIENTGFRAPSTANVNITQYTNSTIILNHTLTSGSSLEIYLPQGAPASVTGVDSYNYVASTLFYTVSATKANVTIEFNSTIHTINLESPASSVQEKFFIRVYSNSTANGNETFTINGYVFEYNEALETHETVIKKNTAQIITLNSLTSYNSARDHQVVLNNSIALTWSTGTISRIINSIEGGDSLSVLVEESFEGFGVTLGFTGVMMIFSVSVYLVVGYEAVFLFWFLGWGSFSYLVTGGARTLAMAFFLMGVGIMLARVWLDRRTS